MKKNNKGFTLIELLAVIVILGLLMAIAIPSVTRYITQSRRKTVVTSIDSYVTSVMTEVNDGQYHFSDSSKVFAIPIECVSLEKGGTNPFGNWMQANTNYWAYVLVQYDSENYNYVYGFTFKDDAGYGMYPTSHANIDEDGSQVKTGYDDLKQPQTGSVVNFLPLDKWNGFNITDDTELIVLEAGSEGQVGDGKTTCTLCQKGDNYEQVEEEKKMRLSSLIKEHNPDIKTNPTLTTTSEEVEENGLYVSTATNSGKPTYYFRGNVKNNYVKFAGKTWKILRINEDGTIRLILTYPIDGYDEFNTTAKKYNHMYYSNSDKVKPKVDEWYKTDIIDKGYDGYVSTSVFCEQAKVKKGNEFTAGNVRMEIFTNYVPSFNCTKDANGYGPLNIKVGLPSYDEVIHAGGYPNQSNNDFYLTGLNIWTMSPAGFSIYNIACTWEITQSGDVFGLNASVEAWIHPVINLNANVKATGTGTSADPYVVQTN